MIRNLFQLLFILLVFLCALFSQPPFLHAAKITDIRFWSAPDHARIVLDLTDPIPYESSVQENPPLMTLEVQGTFQPPRREIPVNDPFLVKIQVTQSRKNRTRIVFYQKKPLKPNIFLLKPYQDKPHRLVIDLIDMAQERKEQEERQRQKDVKSKETKIVVLDPGHGGEDPGAVGPQRTLEKDVVLKIGERVLQYFQHPRGIKAFLTRKGDYFIPLEDRGKIAREYGADLFISLHADGSFNPHARGSSVYCLSLSGATDQAAKILADKENLSNVLGGAFIRPTHLSKDPNLNQILLDLRQNDTLRESSRMADLLLAHIKPVYPIKFAASRQANFIVLRAPDIPSVLLETAFITNREEERLLRRGDFQEGMAKVIASSIKKFFDGSD